MSSVSELQARRAEILLASCLDVSLGTLWHIREDRGKEQLIPCDFRSRRTWQLGLSLRTRPLRSLVEFVPMLHGTSGDQGPVVARDLTQEMGPNHSTSFGRLVFPARISAQEIAPRSKPSQGERGAGAWIHNRHIHTNAWKPCLENGELKQLKAWAHSRRLI